MPFQATEYLFLAFLYDSLFLFFLPCLFCKRVSVLPEYGATCLSLSLLDALPFLILSLGMLRCRFPSRLLNLFLPWCARQQVLLVYNLFLLDWLE